MRIRQIVFAAADLGASRSLLASLLALPTPFRDPGVAEFGLDNAVFCFGDQFIEVISPVQPGTACGRHLERHGDSGYMLILQTDDFDRDTARFAAQGVRSVWRSEHADIRAMHLHPKDVGGAIVSVDQPVPAASWRWGGPDWRVQPGDAGRQRVVGITLKAADPAALAQRWARIFDLPLAQHGAHWQLALDGAAITVQPSPDGRDGVAGFTLAVADVEAVLAQARAGGLAVQGNEISLLGARVKLSALAALAALAGA